MNDGRIAWLAKWATAALLLFSAKIAIAQQDPLGDLGDDEPGDQTPTEEPPAADDTPADEPSEPSEPELPADPDGGVPDQAMEGEEPLDEAEQPPEVVPAADDSDMVVTGSRIRRSNFAQPASVQIMDRKQLTSSGAQNMTDVVKNMSINSGSDLNADVSTATVGSAQFNLRGLGVSSTLVLLNGRRLPTLGAVSSDGSAFVDINMVPLGIIERMEVLKGGASAIYGSDAVAGVVNILTRKRLDGFEVHLGGQGTDTFDQHEWDVSLLGGAQGERTRVLGAISYFKRDPLSADDRDFTDNGRNVSTLGWPSAFLQYNPATGGPRTEMNAAGMVVPVSYRDEGCGKVPLSAPLDGRLNFCTFDFNPYFMLVPNEERTNIYTSLEHDVSDHVMAFFEALYYRSRASRTLSPSYPLLLPVFVPADHPYNPTGDRLRWYGRVAGGNSPPYETDYDSDTLHTVAGIGGDFGGVSDSLADWEWELSGTWSGNRYEAYAQDVLTDNLQEALNSCGPGDDPAGCWNPFSFGPPNSQKLIDRVNGELRSKSDVTLTTVGLDFTGPLFELPGGDLSIAFGGQLRRETAVSNPDHDSNQEAYVFLVGGPDWEADRQILAGYAELLLPVFRGFELQAAGRLEHYDDVGSTADPMLGLSWSPATSFMGDTAPQVSKVRLHGTFSTAFRAPSLLQTNGTITELAEIFNVVNNMGMPMTAPSSVYTAVRTFGNEDLTPQKSTAITAGLEWTPLKSLLAEIDYWRYSYEDIIVKENAQTKVAADFLNMNDPDITRDPAAGIPTRINVRFINAQEVTTHGLDMGFTLRSDFGGQAGTFSAGANASYVLAYEIPQSAVASSLWDEDVVSCDAPNAPAGSPPPKDAACDVAGMRNFTTFARSMPRLRANFPLGWSMGGHNAAIISNLIGSYTDDGDSDPTAGEEYRPIHAQVTFDLQYSYRLKEDEHLATTFKVGVVNLLDTPPPYVNAGYGYDVLTHDPRGRMIYGRLIQEF